jgi:hypothetical protein
MQTEPSKAEPPKRKRRWYQFSLRTLFLVVTAVGVWLGWEAHVVRERKAALEEIQRAGGSSWTMADFCQLWDQLQEPRPKEASATVPFVRAWFGDEPIPEIDVAHDAPPGEEKRIAILFPEANVGRSLGNVEGWSEEEPRVVPNNSQFKLGFPEQTLLKYEPLPSGRGSQ